MNLTSVRSAGRLTVVSALLMTAAAVGAPQAGASVRATTTARCYCSGDSALPGAVAPGGYSAVVTSRTITPAGGTIGSVSVPGGRVTLVIPAGAFPVPVQITLVAPKLPSRDAGDKVDTGVGIQIQENGVAYPGSFRKPLTLIMSSRSVISSSVVATWNGKAFLIVPDATAAPGAATVRFDSHPTAFAVLSPFVPAASEAIPGATTSMTGEPFLGEGILAAVLLALGAGGLLIAIRSSRRARAQCRG